MVFSSYWIDDQDDVIEHYGVKGMKWGVRRAERRRANRIEGERRKLGVARALRGAHQHGVDWFTKASDKDIDDMVDDKELFDQYGGISGYRKANIAMNTHARDVLDLDIKHGQQAIQFYKDLPVDVLKSRRKTDKAIRDFKAKQYQEYEEWSKTHKYKDVE